ncbi:PAS domain-containing sensor histidine kinase [Lichenihabitans sp. Uapishka_5]|uniref:PAS domain-containing sensor histidine kinase n=1 Tax=Lichenihabitans sp. Uapishka_5 TaxID=3037302 RepID=UPI0029E8080A|nr:PAS domain-containing sensor histidine kinase [Lichenihabitans sp. Uapishka_5]MDX7953629.1 PAS domain-containing sensor histidine kinase [Lichenihabitans sp. Uapishka_5]
MTVQTCLKDHLGRLVHPSVQGAPAEALQHAFFIGTTAALSGLALMLVPLFLATGHLPGWRDALTLAWLVLPLLAAAHVSNTGRLVDGKMVVALAWTGLGLTSFCSGAATLGAAAAVLLLVPLEVLTGSNRRLAARLTGVALAGLGGLLVWSVAAAHGFLQGRADVLVVAFAGLRAAALAAEGASVAEASDVARRLDAQRYRVLSEAIGDLVLRYDRAGLVLAASGASERLFGIPSPELMGRGFFERVHVGDRPAFMQAVSQAATGRDSVTVNLRLRISSFEPKPGHYSEPVFAWVEVRTRQFDEGATDLGTEGGPVVVAAVRDITVRVQHEAEIERAKRDAEQANASKDRFIATLSHELRTPLNAIIGFAEMLASPNLAPKDPVKRQEYAAIIGTSGQHLLAVVNSLLDMSKLDAGKFELCCEPFDVADLIVGCCDMVGLKAETQHVTLRREIAPGLDPLTGDRHACKQIVLNLLSNALKFTPPGGQVTVSSRPDGNAVLISVVDTGIGMVPRDLAKLGDPFFQVRNDYDRPYEGTGLGLSVVKGLVGLHGGTITVESAPGEGTRISVRLPLDGRRHQGTSAKIEVINRYPRPGAAALEPPKVQKIA